MSRVQILPPQPNSKPSKTFRFRGPFAVPDLARNFGRGSVVEVAGGKSQPRNGDGAMRGTSLRIFSQAATSVGVIGSPETPLYFALIVSASNSTRHKVCRRRCRWLASYIREEKHRRARVKQIDPFAVKSQCSGHACYRLWLVLQVSLRHQFEAGSAACSRWSRS